ncbi:MAG: hypothetical protein K2L54_04020 [Clostridiales bacterium]|nr:hypothetical protein [Clostridiales bacterium]
MLKEYKAFIDGLAQLCERGVIKKQNKKRFSHYENCDNPCELIYSVCTDLLLTFGESEKASTEYAALCAAAEKFIMSLNYMFVNSDRYFAVVCAYIRITAKANAVGSSSAFKIMGERLEEYNKSLQNIKFGRELFADR